jgi:hypothetical protein
MLRRRSIGYGLLVVGLAVGGCGKGGSGTPQPSASKPAPSPTPHRQYTPPTLFDTKAAVPFPSGVLGDISPGSLADRAPVALAGNLVLAATYSDVTIVDTATGTTKATVKESQQKAAINLSKPQDAPYVTTIGGTTVALVLFPIKIPGEGTTPAQDALELMAVDPAKGAAAWTARITFGDWIKDMTAIDPTVVAVSGTTVVVTISGSNSEPARTYAVDTVKRQVAWVSKDSFRSGTVLGNSVIGFTGDTDGYLSALSLTDGSTQWTGSVHSYQSLVQPAGPNFAMVIASDYGSGQSYAELVDAKGHLTGLDNSLTGDLCEFDGAQTVVCSSTSSASVVALDASSGQRLWSLPDTTANRIAPTVSAVWRGAVYGSTSNGPVVLDGRSGKDLQDHPGIAPFLVNGLVGIAYNSAQQQVEMYPTSG